MVLMKRIGGSTEWIRANEGYVQKPYALYQCAAYHLVELFSGFNGIKFESWEGAPAELDLGCLYCNIIAGAVDEED